MKKHLIAALVALGAVGAQAATSFTISPHTTELVGTVDFGFLDKFDGSLGTLTGATLTLSGAASFAFTGQNAAIQSQTAKLTSTTDLSFGTDLAAISAAVSGAGFTMSGTSGNQTYAVGETKSFGPLSDSDTAILNFGTAAQLAALTGAGGQFKISCDTLSGLIVQGGGGNINTTQDTQAGCGASIVYTFTPPPPPNVPEPGSLAIVGLALAGLAAASRRRKA